MNPDYDAILDASLAEAPTDQAAIPDYDALMDDQVRKNEERTKAVFESSMKLNPDFAAESAKLATSSGIERAAVERNLEDIRRKEAAKNLDTRRLAEESPVLMQQLQDPNFTTQAHDDVPTLQKIEAYVKDSGRALFQSGYFTAQAGIAGHFQGLLDSVVVVSKVYGALSMGGVDPLAKQRDALFNDPLQKAADSFGYIASINERYNAEVEAKYSGLTDAGVLSGFQSLGANLIQAPMFLVEGGIPFSLYTMSASTGGQSYRRARDAGEDVLSAQAFANRDFAVEWGTEVLPLTTLVGGLKAADPFLKTFLKTTFQEVAGEVLVATVLQDLNDWAVLQPEATFEDYLLQRPTAAWQTLVATLIGTGGQVSVSYAASKALSKVTDMVIGGEKATEAAKNLQAALQAAADSKFRERNPTEFRALIEKMAKGEGGEQQNIYVDAEVLNQLAPEVLAEMPSVASQMQAALAANGTVSIPMSEVLSSAPGTPLEGLVVKHGRIGDPSAMSQADAEEAGSKAQEYLKTEAEKVIQQAEDQQAMIASRDKVRDDILAQLTTVGRFSPSVNEAYANWTAAFYTATAGTLGITPEEVAAKYPLKIVNEATGGEVLEQRASPGESGSVNVTTSLGKPTYTWSSKNSDAKIEVQFAADGDSFSNGLEVSGDGTEVVSGRGIATELFLMGLEGSQKKWAGKKFVSESILSAQSMRLYERLIKAGVPLKKVTTNAQFPHYEISSKDLDGIDFGAVRSALSMGNESGGGLYQSDVGVIDQAAALAAADKIKNSVEDEFFKNIWPQYLRQTGGQFVLAGKNVAAAAKAAVADVERFVTEHPKFKDYYKNDWNATRKALDAHYGQKLTDDEFLRFRVYAGLNSPNTPLEKNIVDAINAFDLFRREGSLNSIRMTTSANDNRVIHSSPYSITGTTNSGKAFTMKVFENLVAQQGGVQQAVDYLLDSVTVKDLNAFNKSMGYKGSVGDIGYIRSLVEQATGQSKLIPRMFIFGPKVGAYTLNATGDGRYTTIDVWESRFIRSLFKGLFNKNQGLPVGRTEQEAFVAFNHEFEKAWKERTGETLDKSALQAARWFYILDKTREAGYTGSSTNATISEYVTATLSGGTGAVDSGSGRSGAGGSSIQSRYVPYDRKSSLEREHIKLFAGWRRLVGSPAGATRTKPRAFTRTDSEPARREVDLALWEFPKDWANELFKRGYSAPVMRQLNPETGADDFIAAIKSAKNKNVYGAAVNVYSHEEYRQMKLFLSEDGTSGIAIKKDGDIVSLFNTTGGPNRGVARYLLLLALENGGKKMDNFDTDLTPLYESMGFGVVNREAWNDEFKPEGWDDKTFSSWNGGKPDVVWMEYGAASTLQQGSRGTFSPEKLRITLTPKADLSTFLHETGHFFLEVTADIANQPDAPARITGDMDTLLKWFGVESLEKWNGMTLDQKRPYHERFAESFEEYLIEGKSPSIALQPLFRRFRSFLLNVYKTMAGFQKRATGPEDVQLSDEVRQVFDRMLASEQEIAEAEEVAGLLPDEDATGVAVEKLTARSIRDLKWAMNARGRALKAIQAEASEVRTYIMQKVITKVRAMPVYAVQNWMKGKGFPDGSEAVGAKLDSAALKEMYGEGTTPRTYLPTNLISMEGLHPDVIAGMFDFKDGDTMVREIIEAPSEKSLILSLTEQEMMQEHGDLVDEKAVKEAANAAVHNEARAKSLATELKAQSAAIEQRKDTGRLNKRGAKITVSTIVEAARQFAQNIVSRTTVRDLKGKPAQHIAAERAAGKLWQKETAAAKTEEAVKAKQDQLLNNAAAKAFIEANAELKKILQFFAKVIKGSNKTVVKGGRSPDVTNAIKVVLAAYGVGERGGMKAAQYLTALKEQDPQTYATLEPAVQNALSNAQPLEALTMEELRGLHDAISSMWTTAKRSRQMLVDGKLMDIEDAEEEVMASFETFGTPASVPGSSGALTTAEIAANKIEWAGSILSRVRQWVERIDGGYGGPLGRYFVNPITDGADKYRSELAVFSRRYLKLLKGIEKLMPNGRIEAPELGGYIFGRNSNTSPMVELLHVLLHLGNKSNERKLLIGWEWATEREDGTLDRTKFDAFLKRMTDTGVIRKEHYDWVQSIHNLFEETKVGAQATHREVFGYSFDEITATPYDTPFGTYAGGYVPAMIDSRLVGDKARRELAEIENDSMSFSFPGTRPGFAETRVEGYARKLLLDVRSLNQHINKVLLFTHMEVPVRDVQRLLTRKEVSEALFRIDPTAMQGMLAPWLSTSRRQTVVTPMAGDGGLSRVISTLRNNAGMSMMISNIANALQQPTGIASASAKLVQDGLKSSLTKSFAVYVANPAKMIAAVKAMSPYMDGRIDNEIIAIHGEINKILLNPNIWQSSKEWVAHHSYFMQSIMDHTISTIVWNSAYNSYLAKDPSQKEAVRYADSLVRQTQGSTLPEDVSRMETGTPLQRAFTQFAGWSNMLANTNATGLLNISRGMGLRQGAGKAFYILAMGVLAPLWIGQFVSVAFRGGPDDPDEDGYLDDWIWQVLGLGTLRGIFGAVPGLGAVGNLALGGFNKNPSDDRLSLSPAVSLIESSGRAPFSVYAAIAKEGSSRKAIRDVAALLSLLFGQPAFSAAARPLGYLADVESGKIQPTGPFDFARGLVTGNPSPESVGR